MHRILIGALVVVAGLAIACVAYVVWNARQQTPQVAQQVNFSKAKPDFEIASFGGALLGYDAGEWGGNLSFRDAKGDVTEVIPDNVRAIIPHGTEVVVFTGLAHMGENHGAIYLLRPDAKRMFIVTQLHKLDGAPDMIESDAGAEAINFNVFSGTDDRRGEWIYLCRRLKRDWQLEVLTTCKVRGPG